MAGVIGGDALCRARASSPVPLKGMGFSILQVSGTFLAWSLSPQGGRGTGDLVALLPMLTQVLACQEAAAQA